MQRRIINPVVLTVLVSTSFLVGCGGGDSSQARVGPVAISIAPTTVSSVVNQPTQFTAVVANTTDTGVTWSIQERGGGSIADGLYKAPWKTGTYHVIATSQADPSKSAVATVAVSAVFAFMEEVPSGNLKFPLWSMTPLIGTFGADGKFTTAGVTDPATGQPLTAALKSIALSPDGKKLIFAMTKQDESSGNLYTNIYTANSDGSDVTNLTNISWDGVDNPQFSLDGKQIIFSKWTMEEPFFYQVWVMNKDGSNQHVVYDGIQAPTSAFELYPAFSPHGAKIVTERDGHVAPGGNFGDGIAVMDADGSNVVQLTIAPVTTTGQYTACSDETPAFTNDGTKIAFSRKCSSSSSRTNHSYNETLYSMNPDGSALQQIFGKNDANWIASDPLPVGDKLVFASNMDNPGTSKLDLYSIKPDGTGLMRLTSNTLYDAFNTGWFWVYIPQSPSGSISRFTQ